MTTEYADPNAFLMGGGIPSAKFDTIGTKVTGEIISQPEVVQQTDLDTGKPLFWEDNRPRMQLVVTVQTSERDASIDDDDGKRKFYIKAKLQDAVRQAVRTAKAPGLAIGGVLSITYIADGERKNRGHNPPKLYSATYTPPNAVAANEALMGGQQAAPFQNPQGSGVGVPAVTTAQQAPAPAAVPAGGVDPAVLAAMANLTPEQRKALGL